MLKSNSDYQWQLLRLRLYEKRLTEAVIFFRQNNIEPILIKGWAAARLYPELYERQFNDVDLIVAPEQYKEALKKLNLYKDKYSVDLHKGTKRLDSLSYENLYTNSEVVECGETPVRILCPEDHLRVLCTHWLMDGGARKDRLWDIYYAVKNRRVSFDWDRCLRVVGERRRKWTVVTIGLAHKYLGLTLEDTPIAGEAKDIPKWLINSLEAEWGSDVRLTPIGHNLRDGKMLLKQIIKRIPPNPIQATVDMEGAFDNRPRIFYQIGDTVYRSGLSAKRIGKSIFSKFDNWLSKGKL